MAFVDGPVRVTVPATSANLGPGFDALGLALELRDRLTAEVLAAGVLPGGVSVRVEGEGEGEVALDESHLVVRAMRAAFGALGVEPAGLRLQCRNVVPHARGLGSSSAAIVGGLVLARALVAGGAERLDDDTLLQLAAGMEGHPDNVAPALYGGLTVSGRRAAGYWTLRPSLDPAVGVVALVPPTGLSTEVARDLLPATVSHADAAANAGSAALLVAALAGQTDWLLTGTADRLHQGYREPAMPESLALVTRLRAAGHAAVVSGAGPTVVVLTAEDPDGPRVAEVVGACPPGWQASYLPVAGRGAVVVE